MTFAAILNCARYSQAGQRQISPLCGGGAGVTISNSLRLVYVLSHLENLTSDPELLKTDL